jgi:hypothetical protein
MCLKWDYYVFDNMCWAIRGHHSSRVDNTHSSPYKYQSTVTSHAAYGGVAYNVYIDMVSYSSIIFEFMDGAY